MRAPLMRALLLAGLLLSAGIVPVAPVAPVVQKARADIPGTRTATIQPTPSGRVWFRYPDGNDGAFGTWNIVPAISVATTATGSVNLANYFTPLVGAPAPTYAVCAGYTLPTDFSLASDGTLSWSAPPAASVILKFCTTRSAVTIPSAETRVEAVTPPSSDTTPPTVVTGGQAADGTGLSTVTWDSSSDPFDGEAGSGVESYRITHSTLGSTTIPAVAPGLSKELTLANVGTISSPGAPSVTQDGADWEIDAAGTGMVDGTSSQMAFVNAEVAGDGFIIARLEALTGGHANYASLGLCIRESEAAGAAETCIRWQPAVSSTVGRLQCRGRTTANGNKSTAGSVESVPIGAWVRISRTVSSGVNDCDWSTNGNAWQDVGSQTVPMAGAARYGLAVSSTSAGNEATASFGEVNLNNVPGFSRTFSAAGTVTAVAIDFEGNEAAASVAVTVAPVIPPADTTGPTISVQPTATSGGQTTINITGGAFADPSGVRGNLFYQYAGSSCAGSPTISAEQVSNAFTANGLTQNTAYSFRQQAYDNAGNSSVLSNCVTATTDSAPTPLTAPTGLACAVQDADNIGCTWNAVTSAHHYRYQYKFIGASAYHTYPTQITSTSATITDTGFVVGQPYNGRICATDQAETELEAYCSSAITFTPAEDADPPSEDGIKLHAGNYAGATYKFCSSTYDAANLSLIDEVSAIAEFRGVMVTLHWGCLEGATAGDYSAGFARIDALLNRLNSKTPKRYLMLSITTDEYNAGGTCAALGTSNSNRLPAYIVSMGANGYASCPDSSFKWIANFANAATVDRMIALSAAYAARYNEHPLFEGISFIQETASQAHLTNAGYSLSTVSQQLIRLHRAASAHWTKTHVRLPQNYFGSDSQTRALIDGLKDLPNMAFGPPDTYPEEWRSRRFPGNYTYRGRNTSSGSANSSWSDERGRHAWIAEIQSPDIGDQYGKVGSTYVKFSTGGANSLIDWIHEPLRATHIIWTPNSWQVPSQNSWANQKSFVDGGNATTEADCPAAWTSGCDTN